MEVLTSRSNETVKATAALKTASARTESGRFLLEGARLCADAVGSGLTPCACFFTADALHKYPQECTSIALSAAHVYHISDGVCERLSDTKNPQGVFCVFKTLDKTKYIDKINYNGLYALTDGLQNPENLGALARTAEALGADGLLVCGGCDIYSPKAQRAAMGSLLRLPVFAADDAAQVITQLRRRGMHVWATVAAPDATPVTEVVRTGGTVVVIGNEGSGVSDAVKAASTGCVTIPMNGRAESLNAAAAAAIVLWEFCKQNNEERKESDIICGTI